MPAFVFSKTQIENDKKDWIGNIRKNRISSAANIGKLREYRQTDTNILIDFSKQE